MYYYEPEQYIKEILKEIENFRLSIEERLKEVAKKVKEQQEKVK
jgi:hypothetical protein